MSADEPPFISDRHALDVGWVAGIGLLHHLPLRIVTTETGDYTNRLAIDTPNGDTITLVVPPPPDDWEPL